MYRINWLAGFLASTVCFALRMLQKVFLHLYHAIAKQQMRQTATAMLVHGIKWLDPLKVMPWISSPKNGARKNATILGTILGFCRWPLSSGASFLKRGLFLEEPPDWSGSCSWWSAWRCCIFGLTNSGCSDTGALFWLPLTLAYPRWPHSSMWIFCIFLCVYWNTCLWYIYFFIEFECLSRIHQQFVQQTSNSVKVALLGGRHLSLFVQVASAKVSEVHGTQGPGWVFGHETGTGNRNINRRKKKGKANE